MSEEILVRQGAPTLAGIKTGSLLPCSYGSKADFLSQIRDLNHRLQKKGLRLLVLRQSQGKGELRALLYLYRPKDLSRDLRDQKASEILTRCGYGGDLDPSRCLMRLTQRIRSRREFPHEVGLFLSYPPEDVRGFMDNGSRHYKCAGMWKVYGDEERAKTLFRKYRKCTDIYWKLWQAGATLEQLAVTV